MDRPRPRRRITQHVLSQQPRHSSAKHVRLERVAAFIKLAAVFQKLIEVTLLQEPYRNFSLFPESNQSLQCPAGTAIFTGGMGLPNVRHQKVSIAAVSSGNTL